MEVYQLDSENSVRESITDNMIKEVKTEIKDVAANIRKNHLPRKCDKEKCSKCHYNYLCLSKAEKKTLRQDNYVRGDKKIGSTEVSSKNGER